MQPSRDISRLIEIMAALRHPETGCPWDMEQDFKSIAPYTIEEAYEVADAIERGDLEELRLELGDLLLQSVYHARLAQEEGHFDFGDVVEGITTKMIRRHPHVFGDADNSAEQYSASGMAKETWERIKEEEKAEAAARRAVKGLLPKEFNDGMLDAVPTTLPGPTQALKLQQKMSKVGFDWDDPKPALDKVAEELEEVHLALESTDKEQLEAELGDLLFSVVNVARLCDIDPEGAMRKTNAKVRFRFAHIEKELAKKNLKPNDVSLEEMEKLWIEAKSQKIAP